VENPSRGEGGGLERSLNLKINLPCLRLLNLCLCSLNSLSIFAYYDCLFHIAVYTLVSLLLVLRLLLASLLEIVFNSKLFAIILYPSPIHPPLGDLQLESEPNL